MLKGLKVLIVEDEWLLADHLQAIVEHTGAEALGPVATIEGAMALLDGMPTPPDAATLNVRLVDGPSFPVADRLAAAGVPFAFISANHLDDLPERFAKRPLLAKPFRDADVAALLARLVTPPPA